MSLATVFLLAVVSKPERRAPAWFDTLLAGYSLAYDERRRPVAVADPKTGYYLWRDTECDGADVTLVLTPDVKEIQTEVPDARLVRKPLPSLSTGKGIRIGDPAIRLAETLGKASRVEASTTVKGATDYVYHWSSKARAYDETYTVKAGVVVRIEFEYSSNDA